MSIFAGLHPGWLWVAAAGLLAVAELIVPGVFLVWIAAAAGLAGLVTLAFDPPLTYQLILFGLFSIGSVLIGRYVYKQSAQPSTDPLLNDRASRLIGRVVPVVEAIREGQGRVKVGDSEWIARGHDAPAGTAVRVVGADSTCLRVEALTPSELAAL
jgi:inner membrane protein